MINLIMSQHVNVMLMEEGEANGEITGTKTNKIIW